MNRDKLEQLLAAYIKGTIRRSDLDELLDYIATPDQEARLNEILDEIAAETVPDEALLIDSGQLYKRITEHPYFKVVHAAPQRKMRFFIGVAMILLLLSAVTILWHMNINGYWTNRQDRVAQKITRTVSPSDRLLLRLSDGTEIDLDSVPEGALAAEGGVQLKLAGDQLLYENRPQNPDKISSGFNTISTPKGRVYQISLPDGSRIWLNAATTVTYPVHFESGKREVYINGEAYFEVQKAERWPFIVNAKGQKVEVLGTHFNVSAYADDSFTKTSLIEGSVRISLPGHSPVVLQPGQQSTSTDFKNGIQISEMGSEDVTAWRGNHFTFNNEEVSEVMKKVSRWYDVEVTYQDGMEGKLIGGSIPRFATLDQLMEALQATGLLHYKMEGGRIVIMK